MGQVKKKEKKNFKTNMEVLYATIKIFSCEMIIHKLKTKMTFTAPIYISVWTGLIVSLEMGNVTQKYTNYQHQN